MPLHKRISIFGATGSVGQSTLDVVKSAPDYFSIDTLTAHKNVQKLSTLARTYKAKRAVIADPDLYHDLKDALSGTEIEIAAGHAALLESAQRNVDLVMAAIMGMAGLEPIMKAIPHCRFLAIANKEPLVSAGPLVIRAAAEHGTTLLPVDSEHNAIFQIFEASQRKAIQSITLTASGGPFRESSLEEMQKATPEMALKHPTWTMGQKISIDSATMMNKALEVIEAKYLFDLDRKDINVLIHRQSLVHGMVSYKDGSTLVQMGAADMRTPVTYALYWPERGVTPGDRLDPMTLKRLDFDPVDPMRFPSVNLAYACLKAGAGHCLSLNAANEIAVDMFLKRRIGFLDIFAYIQKVLDGLSDRNDVSDLDSILALDKAIRSQTLSLIESRS